MKCCNRLIDDTEVARWHHRSYLVNLKFVQEISSEIILFGKKLPVAAKRRKEVKERYIRFCNKMR